MPGEVPFGRYALITKIASGGMAELFLARQRGPEGFEKLVAIKRILPARSGDSRFVELFLEEARLAARLSHPNIAQIYDLGIEAETYFLAMEFVSAENVGTLEAKARERGYLVPIPFVLKIAVDVCEALYYAHHLTDPLGRPLRVVHCDISPQNLLVGYDGCVKVVDFGIARADSTRSDRDGKVRGKAGYMSPEQVVGEPLDNRSDLFSLGIVLYELLAGRRLFTRDDFIATARAVRGEPIPPLRAFVADVPPALERVLERLLERDRSKRYNDARALQRDLEAILAESGGVPSNAALSEYMNALFKETLEQRVFAERTMTAVIPLTGTQAAPTIIEAPPHLERMTPPVASAPLPARARASAPPAAGMVPLRSDSRTRFTETFASRKTSIMAGMGVTLGLVVGIIATLFYGRSPPAKVLASPDAASIVVARLPAIEVPPETKQEPAAEAAPADEEARSAAVPGSRPLDPMGFRKTQARNQQKSAFGHVSIDTQPSTQVSLEGKGLGPTPLRDLKLPPGTHRMTFEHPKLGIHLSYAVRVRAGKRTQYRFSLERAASGAWTVRAR